MDYRNLGRSGLQVSVVGLGCNNFGMRMDMDATQAVVDKAIDLGIHIHAHAEVVAAEADDGDLEARTAEIAIVHGGNASRGEMGRKYTGFGG